MWSFLIVLLVVCGLAWWGYRFVKRTVGGVISETKQITQEYGAETIAHAKQVLPYFLGFEGKRRFLVLMQNDTELRPTGGFIGTYATLEIENGTIKNWFVEGTERLDARAPSSTVPAAPAPLKKYLAQPLFYFRDANWSPDFPTASRTLLERYSAQTGDATPFDGVVALTATFMSRMMTHIGSVTVDGVTFTPENFIERLEFEVEYGYEQRGDDFDNRKDLIKDLMRELIAIGEERFLQIWPQAVRTTLDSLADKQVLLFATDPIMQEKIIAQGWSGRVEPVADGADALMVIDANLASLKTDRVIGRRIEHRVYKDTNATIQKKKGAWIGETRITYAHTGAFDWRTSRYRSYTRVYLPPGAQFFLGEGAMERDRSKEIGAFHIESEFGRPVVAAFIAVEPGKSHTLVLRYVLPESVGQSIARGTYTFFVQKQPGTRDIPLTLEAQFDKNVLTADPPEKKEHWGDTRYQQVVDMKQDQRFTVNVAP